MSSDTATAETDEEDFLCDYCSSSYEVNLCSHCLEAQICLVCAKSCAQCIRLFCRGCVHPDYKETTLLNFVDSCRYHLKRKIQQEEADIEIFQKRCKSTFVFRRYDTIYVKIHPPRVYHQRSLLSYKPLNVYTVPFAANFNFAI